MKVFLKILLSILLIIAIVLGCFMCYDYYKLSAYDVPHLQKINMWSDIVYDTDTGLEYYDRTNGWPFGKRELTPRVDENGNQMNYYKK